MYASILYLVIYIYIYIYIRINLNMYTFKISTVEVQWFKVKQESVTNLKIG